MKKCCVARPCRALALAAFASEIVLSLELNAWCGGITLKVQGQMHLLTFVLF